MVIKRENYTTIQGWMVTDLGLKGNSLLIYAIIYGFSQEEGQRFTGSLQYLADWTNSTRQGVLKNLKSLTEAGLIAKEESLQNGVKFCSYHATKFNGGVKQSLTGYETEFNGGVKQSLHNNIPDNSNDNSIYKDSPSDTPADFDRFWTTYPKKVGKEAARKAFAKVNVPVVTLIHAVEQQKRSKQWTKNNGQYIPHPATWLNQGRWEDELEAQAKPEPTDYGDPMDFYR